MSKSFLSPTQADLIRSMDDVNRRMEEQQAQGQAAALGLPYIDLHNFPVDLGVLAIFDEAEAKEMGAVPFYKDQKDLRIGTVNPRHPHLIEKLKELSSHAKVTLYMVSKRSLEKTLKFYTKVLRPKVAADQSVKVIENKNLHEKLKSLADESLQQKTTASEMLEIFFGAAVALGASDIHLEPEEHFFKLRFRMDGVLQDVLHINKSLQKQVTARIKVLAKLKLNIENQAQDGRLTFYFENKPVDVRVSVLPSAYGEEIVMRLLGNNNSELKVNSLGFRSEQLKVVEKVLQKPNGMIITTGPTGSGKTTSLYAFLNELNEPGVKIITLEDPVEYKLEGVVQTPIDHNVDFNFAKGLRAILRQDPDIVMVGEIRDQETAEVAMQAALTGHLVFSTLHTNDSSGAIPRLINMGVKPFVVAPALSCVMAQRLVRRICQNCKTKIALSPQLVERVKIILSALPHGFKQPEDLEFFHSTGCSVCNKIGYKGRVGIYEVLEVTEKVQELILKEASMSDFKKAAHEQGMLTMAQDGLLKALEGITDVEEVFRVAGE
ncbi:MAG: type II/IV secretion system protein [Candidatus Doudnabacteria bacterium]|nr:type II/IV secretion system protein [Candidatus Doudnabacteria bacterium]